MSLKLYVFFTLCLKLKPGLACFEFSKSYYIYFSKRDIMLFILNSTQYNVQSYPLYDCSKYKVYPEQFKCKQTNYIFTAQYYSTTVLQYLTVHILRYIIVHSLCKLYMQTTLKDKELHFDRKQSSELN